jgi:Leucine-rich repeat (LRR) protein
MDTMIALNVSDNKIKSIDGLDQLVRVDAINLSHNLVDSVEQLKNLRTLRWLSVAHNHIDDIANLSSLTSLEYLLIEGNSICQVPDSVLALTNEHLNHRGQWIKLEIQGIERQRGCAHAH